MKAMLILLIASFCNCASMGVLESPSYIRDLKHSIVRIDAVTLEGQIIFIGTAWALSKNELVTANHVCQGAKDNGLLLEITVSGRKIPLGISQQDADDDICIVDGRHGLKPLPIRSNEIKEGEKVFLYGFPFGIPDVLTTGFVGPVIILDNVLWRQLSLACGSGNSGSPILDLSGHVIGVLVMGYDNYEEVSISPLQSHFLRFLGVQNASEY